MQRRIAEILIFFTLACEGQELDAGHLRNAPEMGLSADLQIDIREYPMRHVAEAGWPDHQAPTILNSWFEKPSRVWPTAGGFLVSYEAGEWGGALFYLPDGGDKLSLITRGHISSIVNLGRNTFVAGGGLEHGMEHGAVYRFWVDDKLEWKCEQVFFTWTGTPAVLGISPRGAVVAITKDISEIEEKEDRIVLTLYAVEADGSLQILGPPKKKKSKNSETE